MISSTPTGHHAIVIGGGIAGLLAARVLTDVMECVTLIERDRYPAEPVFRAGVPQGRHVHNLLVRGQQLLEELFPGITATLVARGAIESDFLGDYLVRCPAGWLPQSASRLRGYTCTRLLLEWQVRQELAKCERVHVIEAHEVIDLVASPEGTHVRGVRLRARTAGAGAENELSQLMADLIVDASGRDSHASQWLESLGYAAPAETVVNPFLGYATRLYTLPPDPQRTWKGMLLQPDPPRNLCGGVIWPIEGQRWMVLLAGTGKEYPPTDEEAFLEFARDLPDQALYDVLRKAQPLSPIYGYRRTENRLRHFEHLPRQPEGFVALGDAVCVLNPLYGQGMTVAALGAKLLGDLLRQHARGQLPGLAQHFQKQLAKVQALPWQLATASDLRVPATEGGKVDWGTKGMHWYVDGIVDLLPTTLRARQVFGEVVHMVKPPSSLFHPLLLVKVLTHRRPRR